MTNHPVQVFGTKKHADVRKALRYFSERRVQTQFVDFKVRAPSPGELRRFVQRFGLDALVDWDGKRFEELGLRHARLSDDRWIEKLAEEPLLLRLPLVRRQNALAVGADPEAWAKMAEG